MWPGKKSGLLPGDGRVEGLLEEDRARVKVYWAVVAPVVPVLLWERGWDQYLKAWWRSAWGRQSQVS